MKAKVDLTAKAPTLNELRAFIAVVEDLHFARAALRLGVAAPSLSQAIRRLENKLDAVLFVRTARAVMLTDAGTELLPRARDIIGRVDEAQLALRAGSYGNGRLTIGISSNGFAELTAPIFEAFRATHAGVRLLLRDITDHRYPVTSGEVDIALVRPPVEEQGEERIRFIEVVDEPRVALLADDHRLAAALELGIEELAGERFVEVGPGRPQITDYWAATEQFGGERRCLGGQADTVAGVLQSVAYLGDVVTSIPSVLRFFQLPGIVAVPLVDVPPASMAICARADDMRGLTEDFIRIATRIAAAQITLVPGARLRPSTILGSA